jgi:hypothetical protein
LHDGPTMKRFSVPTTFACIAAVGFAACSSSTSQDDAPCPHSCPATYMGIVLAVTAAADSGAVSGVGATLSGPTTVTMSCEANGTVTVCRWPSPPVTAGTYSLQVAATGFQMANVSATVSVTPDRCGCAWATLQPSAVTLVRGTASVDAATDAPKCGVIRASDYDQSCKVAADCTTVFEGDTCTSQCACPNATISTAARASYHPIFEHPNICACPMAPLPSCVSGVCTMCPPAGCPVKDSGTTDPLVGTWTYSGNVPAQVNITLTFKADKTFTFVETVAPWGYPAGYVPNGCVTTDTYPGTYAESVPGGTNTLTWTFAGGTANAVSGCNDASMDSTGTPMTPDAITSYRNQGLIPPTTTTYSATSTTLVLTSPGNGTVGIGRNPGTTFTKVVLLP